MLTVHYHPLVGMTVPDNKVEEFVGKLIDDHLHTNEQFEVVVGSEVILTMFRIVMMERQLPYNCITFIAYDPKTNKTHHVRIMENTDNYCFETYEYFNITEDNLMRLLKW